MCLQFPGEAELAPRATSSSSLATYSRFNIARQDENCPLSNESMVIAKQNGLSSGKKAGCEYPMMERRRWKIFSTGPISPPEPSRIA